MDNALRTLSINNKNRKYDIYYNLPRQLERYKTNRPLGMKHAKSIDLDVMANKFFFLGKGVE